MKLEEILVILQNKLIVLTESRKAAVATGDLLRVMQIDEETLNTQNCIEKIQSVV